MCSKFVKRRNKIVGQIPERAHLNKLRVIRSRLQKQCRRTGARIWLRRLLTSFKMTSASKTIWNFSARNRPSN